MKNRAFYYLMAFLMLFGAKTTAVALLVDNKNPNIKGTTRREGVTIPRPYFNELDKDRIGKKMKKKKTFTNADVVDSYNSSNGKVRSLGRS